LKTQKCHENRVFFSRFMREKFTHIGRFGEIGVKKGLKTGLFSKLQGVALSLLKICKSS
jgi:hypothetical protein